jgi:hypothetical protein
VPPSPIPTEEVAIHYFRARGAEGNLIEIADPGDTITLEWSWSGGTRATIYHMFGYQLSEPYWDAATSGSRDYTISQRARNRDRFVLFVDGGKLPDAQKMLGITLRCPDEWFFEPAPDICPAEPPLVSDGAHQPFQHGVMLWSQAEDRIYVLFDDGRNPEWLAYQDHFDEGEDPSSDPTLKPPDGFHQPVRGFGMVWREEDRVRERLGWGTAREIGYQIAIQRTSYIKYNSIYIRALNGGVWRLGPEHSDWEWLTAGEE